MDKAGRVGLALPLAYQSGESNAMYYQTNLFVTNPALTIKLGPKTSLLTSWEFRFNMRDNIRNFFLTDNARAPDGSFYGSFIADRPSTDRVLTTPNQRDFRFDGPDTFRKERTYVSTYRLDHRFSSNLQWWGGYALENSYVRERSFNIALRNANDASIPLRVRTDPRFLALLRPSFGTAQPQILDIRPNNVTNSAATLRPKWASELYYGAASHTGSNTARKGAAKTHKAGKKPKHDKRRVPSSESPCAVNVRAGICITVNFFGELKCGDSSAFPPCSQCLGGSALALSSNHEQASQLIAA